MADLDRGAFSLLHFYEGRARRILPALFCVVIVCLPFSWLWLAPHDLYDFGQSLLGVISFSSNMLFWKESGYFSTASELKPLLHTWSLAVEEQFYLLFPLAMIVVFRFGKAAVLGALVAVFIACIVIATLGVIHKPAAAFFLLPTRAWELLLGALCAVYLNYKRAVHPDWLNQIGSVIGTILILGALATFTSATKMPGPWALIPTCGAGLLLMFAQPCTYVGRILA